MSRRKPLVLFGLGHTAEVLHHRLKSEDAGRVVAFTVDAGYLTTEEFDGLPVTPFESLPEKYPPEDFDLMIAIGYLQANRLRAERFKQAKEWGYHLPSYVNPSATLWDGCVIGENCRIGANAILQPFSEIGVNTTIATACIIGHHARIGDHVFIAPGSMIGGAAEVGDHSFLGYGSIVRNRIKIAPRTVAGAGSLILADTEEGGVYLSQTAQKLPVQSDDLPLV